MLLPTVLQEIYNLSMLIIKHSLMNLQNFIIIQFLIWVLKFKDRTNAESGKFTHTAPVGRRDAVSLQSNPGLKHSRHNHKLSQ